MRIIESFFSFNEKLNNNLISGKATFNTFLKAITQLGQKENKLSDEIPKEFLLYYRIDNLNIEEIKLVFNRYKSLSNYQNISKIKGLYFGLKTNGYFEYGALNKEHDVIGQFKATNTNLKWINSLKTVSANSLKSNIKDLNYKKIILFGIIKKDVLNFNPNFYKKKSSVTIKKDILSFSYYGYGKWLNGKIDNESIDNIKKDFNIWIKTKKWNNKITYKITANNFWTTLQIKI